MIIDCFQIYTNWRCKNQFNFKKKNIDTLLDKFIEKIRCENQNLL